MHRLWHRQRDSNPCRTLRGPAGAAAMCTRSAAAKPRLAVILAEPTRGPEVPMAWDGFFAERTGEQVNAASTVRTVHPDEQRLEVLAILEPDDMVAWVAGAAQLVEFDAGPRRRHRDSVVELSCRHPA